MLKNQAIELKKKNGKKKSHNDLSKFVIFVWDHIQRDSWQQEACCTPETLYTLEDSSMCAHVHKRESSSVVMDQGQPEMSINDFPSALQNRWRAKATGQTSSLGEAQGISRLPQLCLGSPRNCPNGQAMKANGLSGECQEVEEGRKEIN